MDRDFRDKRDDRRDFRRDDRKNYRRDRPYERGIEFERKKMKDIRPEALERSKFNNMVVDKLGFHDRDKYITVTGKQLNLYTLMPSRPILTCPYTKLGMTYTDPKDKRTFFQMRMCLLDQSIPTVCRMTTEKKEIGKCFGVYTKGSSLDFWVVSNGTIDNGKVKKPFKTAFFNKNLKLDKEEFSINPDIEKANSLKKLYEAMRNGSKYLATIPKPGNLLFHTLFSGDVKLIAVTTTGEDISGIVKGYENVPGGQPSLKLYIGPDDKKLRMLPLYMVGYMIVEDFSVDLLAKRCIQLMTNGHIIIPHRGNNTILDICRSDRQYDMIIHNNGDIVPFDHNNRHDYEVRDIIFRV